MKEPNVSEKMKEILLTSSSSKLKIAVNHYRSSPKRKKVLILCHGCFMSKDARPFRDMSNDLYKYFDVITMDFRGHGRSTGLFTFTAKEPDDLAIVVNFAKEIYPKIGIIGFSLGAATAIIYTAEKKDVQSLIAVSAPTKFENIENHFMNKESLIFAARKFELGKSPNIRPGNIFSKKTKPIDVVKDISPIPALFISGSKDPIIHPRHTAQLHEKAKTPKSLESFKGGLHAEELYLESREKFIGTCKDWFDKTLD